MKLHELLFAALTLGFCPVLLGIAETPDTAVIPLPPDTNVTMPVAVNPLPTVTVTPCEPAMPPCQPAMTSCEPNRKPIAVRRPLIALRERMGYVMEPVAVTPCEPGDYAKVRKPIAAPLARRLLCLRPCCR